LFFGRLVCLRQRFVSFGQTSQFDAGFFGQMLRCEPVFRNSRQYRFPSATPVSGKGKKFHQQLRARLAAPAVAQTRSCTTICNPQHTWCSTICS
jgi:hypothetical protein